MKTPRIKPPSPGKVRVKPPTMDVWTVKREHCRMVYVFDGQAFSYGASVIDRKTRTIHLGSELNVRDICDIFNAANEISRENRRRATFQARGKRYE